MKITGHPYLGVLKFKEVFTFNFLELLPVGHFAFICHALYDSENFFSIVFGEAIQKFFPRASAIGGDGKFHGVKFALV
jgi:hypothetical protein